MCSYYKPICLARDTIRRRKFVRHGITFNGHILCEQCTRLCLRAGSGGLRFKMFKTIAKITIVIFTKYICVCFMLNRSPSVRLSSRSDNVTKPNRGRFHEHSRKLLMPGSSCKCCRRWRGKYRLSHDELLTIPLQFEPQLKKQIAWIYNARQNALPLTPLQILE